MQLVQRFSRGRLQRTVDNRATVLIRLLPLKAMAAANACRVILDEAGLEMLLERDNSFELPCAPAHCQPLMDRGNAAPHRGPRP